MSIGYPSIMRLKDSSKRRYASILRVRLLKGSYGKTYDQTHHSSVRTTRQSSDRAYQGTLRVSIGHCAHSPCPTHGSQGRRRFCLRAGGHSSPCLERQGPPVPTNADFTYDLEPLPLLPLFHNEHSTR